MRLKDDPFWDQHRPGDVSILLSAIKSNIDDLPDIWPMFQFYLVRLKVEHSRGNHLSTVFQFYLVRLKANNWAKMIGRVKFQFYLVRLKVSDNAKVIVNK